MRFEAIVLAAAMLQVQTAQAFWGKGHLIVARRAEAVLDQQASPELIDRVMKELHQLSTSHPDMIVSEKDHPFTECATFADEIKDTWGGWQTIWHFIDQPYLDEPDTTIEDFPGFEMSDYDVINALTDLSAFLKGEVDASTSKYVAEIAEYFPEEADQRSFSLRMIIHYMGDLHQPLHASAEVDETYPDGDAGGNFEQVPEVGSTGVTNLHAIWDSVIYTYTGYETMPFDESEWEWYTEQADKISAKHPIEQDKILPGQFATWANESFELTKSVVYDGFKLNGNQTPYYLARAKQHLETRMMYGGQRLADLVIDIYSNPEDTTFLQ